MEYVQKMLNAEAAQHYDRMGGVSSWQYTDTRTVATVQTLAVA